MILTIQFEPGKHDGPHPPPSTLVTSAIKAPQPQPATTVNGHLAPTQFAIRATSRSPPPTPRNSSPVRARDESKLGKYSTSYYDYASDSAQSSPESSASSTPRVSSPQLIRSPERSREHSRDSSPMPFRHHPSALGFDTPGAASTAIAG